MSLLDLMLLTALALALAVGGLRIHWLWLVACDAGLATAAWIAGLLLIVKVGEAVVAEDYLNDMTILNAGVEIAAFWLSAVGCSSLGYVIVRLMRRTANGS